METILKARIANSEKQFFNSLNRFELLSIATKEGIWEYDFVTKQSYYNIGMFDLFGYTAEEMEDNNTWWRNNLHVEDKENIINQLNELYKGSETVWWGQYRFLCKNGTYKKVLDRLFVVRDENNKPIKLIGTMQDLTELDILQNEVNNIKVGHKRAMVKAMMLSEEQERKKISDELHENINQILASIKMRLGTAEKLIKAEDAFWINDAQALLNDSIKDIKTIANRLSPLTFDNFGLSMALDEFLISLKKEKNVQYHLFTDDDAIARTGKEIQTLIFRITQWYLIQFNKFYRTNTIILKLITKANKLHLIIETDTPLVNISDLKIDAGFSIIEDRVDAFEGTIHVEKSIKTGNCSLIVTLPK